MAPSTSGFGARSEPMASTAITVFICRLGTSVLAPQSRGARTRFEQRRTAFAEGTVSDLLYPAASRRNVCLPSLFDFNDLAPLVIAALRADAMRHLRLVTVGALGCRARGQEIVRATSRSAPFGVSPFRICHV